MDVRPNTITWTIAEYCSAFNRKEVLVDRRYQRNSKVWPARARSYLIETILKGFPIPKLALHQTTDFKSKKTIKYIIDGQQRTKAIVDFFNDDLRLSQALDFVPARGKRFASLDDELKQAFLSHPLQLDMFEATSEEDVREYFRRINSFTAPLNSEEKRNAQFQGNMKWFMIHLAEQYSDSMVLLDTLTEKKVVRMADQKLLAEVVHALLEGVQTTDARKLNSLYRDYEREDIPRQEEIEQAVRMAFDKVLEWNRLQETNVVKKSYNLYSLLLGVIGVGKGWDNISGAVGFEAGQGIADGAEDRLLELADALTQDEEEEGSAATEHQDFVKAARAKTNTREQRETRIHAVAVALRGEGK